MPPFECQVCGTPFEVSPRALAKYPGWTPRFCRAHGPRKAVKIVKGRRPAAARDGNLTRAEVLSRYTGGPQTGLFTDGSSVPNPGPGGWGVVWVEAGEIKAERHGHDPDTTNNQMELRALIEAYRLLPAEAALELHTDSRLCVDTITRWAPGWERQGWKRKGGPIKNLALVQELLRLHRAHPSCSLRWIKAHSGHLWNEYADSLATAWQRAEA